MDFAEQNSEVIASLLYMRRPELVRTLAAGTDPEEMYYSFDDMARRNNGLWRTFRQAQYLWARVTAARYLHGGAEADAWARRLAWYDEVNPHQLLTQFFLPIVRRTKDVSLEVAQGEVIGIIGRNGAGKSTLLKLLSRITEPTSGKALLHGRVGSLLEVGTGFHPELTGRENIYLSGAILGMRRSEVERKFDEIVAFAEVDRFLDTPVKRYSSGMYVRLAFAVAAHLETEILLMDEVLAVGDAAFQRKCLGKMGDDATQGRTVLFVSHNMVAVQNLCPRAIWIQDGQVAEMGGSREIVSHHLSTAAQTQMERVWPDPASAPGNE